MATRELVVLRHAKSSWDSGAPSDFERPLSPRGERDAPRMGRWMRARGILPDLVVASPAVRARQTARRVVEAISLAGVTERLDRRVYDAGLADLLEVLAEVGEDPGRVLLVGHNPGLESLVAFLAGGEAVFDGEKKAFPTAALARFAMPGDWSDLRPGDGRIMDLMRPKRLPD